MAYDYLQSEASLYEDTFIEDLQPASSFSFDVSTWAPVGKSLFSAIGGIFSAASAASHANTMLELTRQSIKLKERAYQTQFQAALSATNRNIESITYKYGQLESKQRTGFAANGVKLNVGSAKETLVTTNLLKQIDANTAYANGINAAMGYMSKATATHMADIAAANSKTSVGLAATDSLLSGAMDVMSTYYDRMYRIGSTK